MEPYQRMMKSLGMSSEADDWGEWDDGEDRSSFRSTDVVRDPLTSMMSPAGTAQALRATHRRGEGGYGHESPDPLQRQQARMWAQHATSLLTNPELPVGERAGLVSALQQAGAPVWGDTGPTGAATGIATVLGPGMLPGNTGVMGARGKLSGLSGIESLKGLGAALAGELAKAAQVVSVWREQRPGYDYYLVPRGVTLRAAPPPEGKPKFGEALEQLLPSLPKASVKIGQGEVARGRIVVDRNGGGMSLGALVGIILDKMEK